MPVLRLPLIAALLVVCPPPPFAHGQGVAVGGKVGVTVAPPPTADPGNLTKRGLMAGITAVLHAERRVTLQAALVYSERGFASNFENFFQVGSSPARVDVEDRITISYLEFPVLGRLRVPVRDETLRAVRFVAGPSLALQVGCRRTLDQRGVDQITGEVVLQDLRNLPCGGRNARDVSFAVGGGVDLAFGGRILSIGVRYSHDVLSLAGGSLNSNRIWTLSLGSTVATLFRDE